MKKIKNMLINLKILFNDNLFYIFNIFISLFVIYIHAILFFPLLKTLLYESLKDCLIKSFENDFDISLTNCLNIYLMDFI